MSKVRVEGGMRFESQRETDEGIVEVIREKFLSLQVCASVHDPDRLTAIVNEMHPCGTSLGWVLSKREETQPVDCSNANGRRHYLFDC